MSHCSSSGSPERQQDQGSDLDQEKPEDDDGSEGEEEELVGRKKKKCYTDYKQWDETFLEKFATVLLEHPFLLQSNTASTARRAALERVGKQMARRRLTVSTTSRWVLAFKRIFFKRMRLCACRAAQMGASEPLCVAPSWARIVEPLMRDSPELKQAYEAGRAEGLVPSVPLDLTAQEIAEHAVETLMRKLTSHARALRTLDPRLVCRDFSAAPALEDIWKRMLSVVRQKLEVVISCGDSEAGQAARGVLREAEWRLLDAALLHDGAWRVVREEHARRREPLHALVAVFHLAQLFRLEEMPTHAQWRAAHAAYRARGRSTSAILLQRRWHELKWQARRLIAREARGDSADNDLRLKPAPIHMAIVKRFPHVVTQPLPTWQELVASGGVIEEITEGGEAAPDVDQFAQLDYTLGYEGEDEDDDLILIEREIETIDLLHVDDTDPPAQVADFKEALEIRRNNRVKALEEELERQLHEIECGAPTPLRLPPPPHRPSLSPTLPPLDPSTEPVLMFDSDEASDEDMRDSVTESKTVGVKLEMLTVVENEHSAVENVEREEGCGEGEEEPTIDPKLLMTTSVSLVKVDSTSGWKRHATDSSIDIHRLDLVALGYKRPRVDDAIQAAKNRLIAGLFRDDNDSNIQILNVKPEIGSEMTSDEGSVEGEGAEEGGPRARKRVQLPDIAEVRRINQNMLTAQVAPLTAHSAPTAANTASGQRGAAAVDWRRLSDEPSLCIDETRGEDWDNERVEEAGETMSRAQLHAVLHKLYQQRAARQAQTARDATHCCTARRHRAINDARKRIAAHANRNPPHEFELHRSRCPVSSECRCCCKHLLDPEGTARALVVAQETLYSDIQRLLAAQCAGLNKSEYNSKDGETTATKSNKKTELETVKKTQSKKKSKKKKRADSEEPSEATGPSDDPLQEWIRQKNITSRFFNLNLKKPPASVRIAPTPPKVPPIPPKEPPTMSQANGSKIDHDKTILTPTKTSLLKSCNEPHGEAAYALVTVERMPVLPNATLSSAKVPPNKPSLIANTKTTPSNFLLKDVGAAAAVQSVKASVNTNTPRPPVRLLPQNTTPIMLFPVKVDDTFYSVPITSTPPPQPEPSHQPTDVRPTDGIIDLCDDDSSSASSPASPPPPPASPPPPPASPLTSKNNDILVRLPAGISVGRKRQSPIVDKDLVSLPSSLEPVEPVTHRKPVVITAGRNSSNPRASVARGTQGTTGSGISTARGTHGSPDSGTNTAPGTHETPDSGTSTARGTHGTPGASVLLNDCIANPVAGAQSLVASPSEPGTSNVKVFQISKDGRLRQTQRTSEPLRANTLPPSATTDTKNISKVAPTADRGTSEGSAARVQLPRAPRPAPLPAAPRPRLLYSRLAGRAAAPAVSAGAAALRICETWTKDGQRVLVVRRGRPTTLKKDTPSATEMTQRKIPNASKNLTRALAVVSKMNSATTSATEKAILRTIKGGKVITKRNSPDTSKGVNSQENTIATKNGNIVISGQGNGVATQQEKTVSTTQGNTVVTQQEKTVSTTQGNTVVTQQEKTVSTTQGNTVVTQQEKTVSTTQGNTVVTRQEKTVSTTQGNTVAPQQKKTVSNTQANTVATQQEKTVSTTEGNTVATQQGKTVSTSDENTSLTITAQMVRNPQIRLTKTLQGKHGFSDKVMRVQQWASTCTGSLFTVQCLDLAVPYYTVTVASKQYYVVCARELRMQAPSFWSARAPTAECVRLALPPAGTRAAPAPIAARKEGFLYKMLCRIPLICAKVLYVIRSAEELARVSLEKETPRRATLERGKLWVVDVATGGISRLRLINGTKSLQITCSIFGMAKAIMDEVSRFQPSTTPPRRPPKRPKPLPIVQASPFTNFVRTTPISNLATPFTVLTKDPLNTKNEMGDATVTREEETADPTVIREKEIANINISDDKDTSNDNIMHKKKTDHASDTCEKETVDNMYETDIESDHEIYMEEMDDEGLVQEGGGGGEEKQDSASETEILMPRPTRRAARDARVKVNDLIKKEQDGEEREGRGKGTGEQEYVEALGGDLDDDDDYDARRDDNDYATDTYDDFDFCLS